jgi:hemolysin activation/secretion protein
MKAVADSRGSSGLARAAVLALALQAGAALAQSAQPPVRPADQPVTPPREGAPTGNAEAFRLPPIPTGPRPRALPGAATRQVEAFVFEGRTVVEEAALQALARPYAGRPVSGAELEELRLQVTRLLVERGFVNSGAVIPDEPYRDGRFRYRIVEGRIGEVRVAGQGRLAARYVAERLVHGPDEVLHLPALQDRFQRLLADPLIARLNARLVPGAEPGRAHLEVDVTRAAPYRLSAFANNHRPPSIGEGGGGLTGSAWNLTGWGDVLDATLVSSRGSDRHSVGWSMPMPRAGTLLALRRDRGDVGVIEEPVRSIDIASRVDSLDLSATQPLVDTMAERFAIGLVWTRRENRTTLLGEPFSFTPGEPDGVSRLRAWRLQVEYARRWPEQTLALRGTFSSGRTNIAADLAPALAAPDWRYAFWLGQAQIVRRLDAWPGAQAVLRGTVQRSGDRLLPLERIAIGGVASVRGYRENQLVRDTGYLGSVELQVPVFGAGAPAHRLRAGPFLDWGRARNQAEPAERLCALGVALDWRIEGFQLELHAAKRLVTPRAAGGRSLQDKGVHVQVRYELL